MTDTQILLLFDIDGTLLHTEGASRRSIQEAFATVLGCAVDFTSYSFAGKTDLRIFTDLLQLCGIEGDSGRQKIRPLFSAYLQNLERLLPSVSVRVYPGVRALLDRLRSDPRFAVALLTGNQRPGARLKLEAAGLLSHFPDLTGAFGDDSTRREPLFDVALAECSRRFGRSFSARRTVVIGDSVHDVRCARSGGAAAVAVGTGYDSPELVLNEGPDLFLPDLTYEHQFFAFLMRLGENHQSLSG